MEIKIFELSVEEQLRTFEQMNFEIAKRYESQLERAEKALSKFDEVVFKYDLPLPKYELTLRQIVQHEGIYTRALMEEINWGAGMPEGYTYSNHRIEYSYNKYIEYITKLLLTLSKYKEILVATIEKIKANKLNNSKPTAEQPTFEYLFKEKSDVPKIIDYVKEFISDEGEWIYKPQVRCLVALCMVLEKKGYFLNTWTNPIKAQALSLKFGVPCTPKSFQASERGKSEHLIELFNIIPTKIIS